MSIAGTLQRISTGHGLLEGPIWHSERGLIVADVIVNNPAELERYKNGETKLFAFFLGQVMKAAKGNADPASATEALKKALK